jgi:hypothetical protein
MIIGVGLLTLVGVWIGRAAWTCLAATRAPAPA